MHEDFTNKFKQQRKESLLKTEALFTSNKSKWLEDFENHFTLVYEKTAKLQRESNLKPISFMDYTMLNTNFINRRYVSEIWIYGDEWYCDKEQVMVYEYDVSYLFIALVNSLFGTDFPLTARFPSRTKRV